jgi:hypothetical protein
MEVHKQPAKGGEKMRCNVCRVEVPEKEHRQHLAILDSLDGLEDCFVHVTGPSDEFDADGAVVVCDRHFVAELATNGR